MQWPMDLVKSLIKKAEEEGEAEAELKSPREAVLFQFAVKNYKRRNNVGSNLTTKVVGNNLLIQRKAEVKIKELVS